MKKSNIAVLVAASMAASAALAQMQVVAIDSIKADPASAKVGQEVQITVGAAGDGPQFCGMVVRFGDGSESQVKIDGAKTKFPVTIAKTYKKPGTYSIKAEGKKITTHFGCNGVAEAKLTVEGAVVASHCPDGYKLAGKVGKGGDFTCKAGKGAKVPEKVAACADTLEYFQTKTTLGCRKAKK